MMQDDVKTNDSAAREGLLVLSATLLGTALQIRNGTLTPVAIGLVAASLALALFGCCVVPRPIARRIGDRQVVWIGLACVAWQFVQFIASSPGIYIAPVSRLPFFVGLGIAIVASIAAVMGKTKPTMRFGFALVVMAYLLIGFWVIDSSRRPPIDVYYFQHDSAQALLHGINPYTISFPDLYTDAVRFYGPGMSADGRLQFGLPYLPLSLFMIMPAAAIGADFRVTQLVAMALTAIAIALIRRDRIGKLIAIILLFSPRSFFVLEQGWTEPLLLFLLAGTVWVAVRARRWLPVALGLFLVSKQYVPLTIGAAFLIFERPMKTRDVLRLLGGAGVVGLAVTLPLALCNWSAFWKSAVVLQFHIPFRADSLSFAAAILGEGGRESSASMSFAAAAMATTLVLLRRKPSPGAFAAGVALIAFAFISFNKQAFANYYYFVIGALCIAAAATPAVERPSTQS